MRLWDIHGGGLSGTILAQKRSNLALIKVHGKAIHGRRGAGAEHLDQVLDTDALQQVSWLCFKERLTCTKTTR